MLGNKHSKKLLKYVGAITICYLVLCGALSLFNLTLMPNIEKLIIIPLVMGQMLILAFSLVSIKYNKLWIILVLILCIIMLLCLVFFDQFYIYKTDENGNMFIGIGDKLTGISETEVKYYRCYYNIFMSTDCDFVENYGRVLGGWKSILSMNPYDVYYNDMR